MLLLIRNKNKNLNKTVLSHSRPLQQELKVLSGFDIYL